MAYIGNIPAEKFTSVDIQNFTVSATANYTLDRPVANENEIELFINNVRQHPGSGKAYTASGTALTLSEATAGTDTMYCVYQGKARQTVTPATSSVTNAMLAGSIDLTSKVTGALPQANIADEAINEAKMQISNAPTNGYMLTAQSGNTGGLTWAEAPSGIYNVVRSAAFSSGDSYMEMTNAFNSTYRNYYIKMEQLKPNTDGADLRVEFGQSDGTYSAAANFGARMIMYNGSLHHYGGTNASGFTPTWSMDNGAWHNVELYVYDPMSTTDGKHQYVFLSESKRYDQEYGAVFGGGMYGVAAALPRLKVKVNTGNFTEGRITVYGITNTGNV